MNSQLLLGTIFAQNDFIYSEQVKSDLKTLSSCMVEYFSKKHQNLAIDFQEQKNKELTIIPLLKSLNHIPYCIVFHFKKMDNIDSEITVFLSNESILLQFSCDNEQLQKSLNYIFKQSVAKRDCNMYMNVGPIYYDYNETYKKYLTNTNDVNSDIFGFLRRQIAGKFMCHEFMGINSNNCFLLDKIDILEISMMQPSNLQNLPTLSGGSVGKYKYKNRSYKVHVGKRGGRYIISNNKKIYI
jgi:hypothetical protein